MVPFFCLGCQSTPLKAGTPSTYIKKIEGTYWSRYVQGYKGAHLEGESGFYPLYDGFDAFNARIESIRRATVSIDVQYYIWHDDLVGRLIWLELLRAANRGVRVRVLLDDLNIGQYEERLRELATHPHIEIRMFNPLYNRTLKILELLRFATVNRRMHNKSLVVDNTVAIVGGRNIGDEYFTASTESNFGDFDLWCFGVVVTDISRSFDSYWNHRLSQPIEKIYPQDPEVTAEDLYGALLRHEQAEGTQEYLREAHEGQLYKRLHNDSLHLVWGKAQVIVDSPDKIEGKDSKKSRLNAMTALPIYSHKEIFIVSPYFIPGKKGLKYFARKVKSGVEVKVFTNSLESNDVPLVFAGYSKYRKELLQSGVELWEMRPRLKRQLSEDNTRKTVSISSGARLGLHGKVYIFDQELVLIGSMNLDPRSVELNSELGVLVKSAELASQIQASIERGLEEMAYHVVLNDQKQLEWHDVGDGEVYYKEPEASTWKKIKTFFLSLFVPESLL